MATNLHIILGDGELLPGGNAQLLLDEVHTGDHLRNGVLHLDAGVHLDEVELIFGVIEDELDGSGVFVLHLFTQINRGFLHLLAQLIGQHRRRAFLNELLVAALRGAVALAQGDGIFAIGQHLDLNVADIRQEALDVDRRVIERGLCLVHDLVEILFQRVLGFHDAHTATTTTGGSLNQQREAGVMGNLQGLVELGDHAVGARHGGNTGGLSDALGRDLVTHQADVLGRRANKADLFFFHHADKIRLFGQEAVARVNGIRLVRHGCGDDQLGAVVALGNIRRADAYCLIGELYWQGVLIAFGISKDGLDTQFLAGANDAKRNLTAVSNEHAT